MSDTALRIRSASEIVDAAFKLYARNLGQYILVTGVAYSPSLIGTLLFRPDQTDSVGSAIGYLVTALISIIAMVLMTGTVTALGSRAYLGARAASGSVSSTSHPDSSRLQRSSCSRTTVQLHRSAVRAS